MRFDFLAKRLLTVAAVVLAASTASAGPTSRTNASMTFDGSVGRVVLFGGATGRDSSGVRLSLGDTWEWTGLRWVQLFPSTSPSPRSGASLAYASNHRLSILFGGFVSATTPNAKDVDGTLLAETWMYRDRKWSRLNPADSPPARRLAAMAYDPLRDRMVLYGGATKTDNLYDSWEFDGATWRRIAAETPKLELPSMVWDGARNEMLLMGIELTSRKTEMFRLRNGAWEKLNPEKLPLCSRLSRMVYQSQTGTVLFVGGGCAIGVPNDETWEWDGSNWTELKPLLTPGAIQGHAAAYDPIRGETVLFGGIAPIERSLTYLYRGGSWRRPEMVDPGLRSIFVFASDPDRQGIWLFGGHDDWDQHADLWFLSKGRWTPVEPSTRPLACTYPVGAYDTDRKRLVVLCQDGATWEFDGSQWFDVTPSEAKNRTSVRRFSAAAYDATIRRVVVYGGWDDLTYLHDTWTWDGTRWTKADKKKTWPRARILPVMFFDPSLKKTVLYGGVGRPGEDDPIVRYKDMWTFDGTTWTEITNVSTPPTRYGAQVGVNPSTSRVIVFGGKSEDEKYLNDQWEWNGTAWTKVEPPSPPSPRMNGGLAWDPSAGVMSMYGGYAVRHFDELWTFDGVRWSFSPAVSGRRRAVSAGPTGGSVTAGDSAQSTFTDPFAPTRLDRDRGE